MHRIDTPSNANSVPAPLPQGTPGYFKEPDPGQHNGTEVSADWLNAVQEEIARVVEDLGGTLSKADNQQLKALLGPLVKGIRAAASDTGTVSTTFLRALVASAACRATGLESACVASQDSTVTGTRALVAGSVNSTCQGANSAILGSTNCTAEDANDSVLGSYGCDVDGGKSAAVASTGCSVSGGTEKAAVASEACEVTGSHTACIASGSCDAGGPGKVEAATLASYDSQATNDRSACVASYTSTASGAVSAVVAGDASTASGQRSTVQAALGGAASGGMSSVLASKNVELADDNSIGGGFNGSSITPNGTNQNLMWKINSVAGIGRFAGTVYVGGNVNTNSGYKVLISGATGAITADGKVTATAGLAVGYDTDGNHDPATVNAPSGKVTEFWVGGSVWSSGGIQTQTVNCDKVGADSIVLVSVQASDGSPAVYRNLSCGVREQAAGSFTIWARNEGTDLTDPSIAWRFVVVNPV